MTGAHAVAASAASPVTHRSARTGSIPRECPDAVRSLYRRLSPSERRKACTRPRIAFATWRSSATAVVARPRCTRRCCSRPGRSTASARCVDGTTVVRHRSRREGPPDVDLAALASFEWQERKVNLIDTPGDSSFIADALGALRVCESAVFVVNAVMGVEVHTTPAVAARRRARPRAAGVRQHARSRARRLLPHARLAQVRLRPARRRHRDPDRLRARDHGRDRPRRHEGLRVRTPHHRRENCSEIPIPEELQAQAEEYREKLMDEVAENSDALMERYLEGEEISHEEIVTALKDGTNHGAMFPVTCGVATRNLGTNRLLDAIVEDLPSPVKHGGLRGRRDDARAGRGQGAVRLRVQDPRRSVRRADQPVPRLPGHDHAGLAGAQHARPTPRSGSASWSRSRATRPDTPTSSVPATSARSPSSRRPRPATGWPPATSRSRCPSIKLPAPVMAFSIGARGRKGDEEKVFTALRRLQEEDPTIDLHRDAQTGEQIVAGLSQVHVEVIVERLQVALRRRRRPQAAARPLPGDDSQGRPRPTGGTRSRPAAAASSATATSRSSR